MAWADMMAVRREATGTNINYIPGNTGNVQNTRLKPTTRNSSKHPYLECHTDCHVFCFYSTGYGVLDRRTKCCHQHIIVSILQSCPLSRRIFARLGSATIKRELLWRCYCSNVLFSGKYTFNFTKNVGGYYSKSSQILAIN